MAAVTTTREFSRGLVSARKSATRCAQWPTARTSASGTPSDRRPSRVGTRSAELGRDRPADAQRRRAASSKSDAMRSERQHERRGKRQRAHDDVRGVDGDVLSADQMTNAPSVTCASTRHASISAGRRSSRPVRMVVPDVAHRRGDRERHDAARRHDARSEWQSAASTLAEAIRRTRAGSPESPVRRPSAASWRRQGSEDR